MIESRFSMKFVATLLCADRSSRDRSCRRSPPISTAITDPRKRRHQGRGLHRLPRRQRQQRQPEWPNLAGQNAAYIHEQLVMFKAKKRNNPIMQPIVDPLSEQDFADLAAFFSTQTPSGPRSRSFLLEGGRDAVQVRRRFRAIPACAACHGPAARAIRAPVTRPCARSIRCTP
jgi:cytochrome c553